MPKTNAVRVLDRLKIAYELREYELDPEDLSAETVARKVGLPLEQVFKTLVGRGRQDGDLLPLSSPATRSSIARRSRVSLATARPTRSP